MLLIDQTYITARKNNLRIRVTLNEFTGMYEFMIDNPQGVARGVLRVELDGKELPGPAVPLLDDAGVHSVRVTLGTVD